MSGFQSAGENGFCLKAGKDGRREIWDREAKVLNMIFVCVFV